jgi:phenylacetate-CoA ligase
MKRLQYQTILRTLQEGPADKLKKTSEKKALEAYQEALKNPLYQKITAPTKSASPYINSIESFKKNVPLSDKQNIFSNENLPLISKKAAHENVSGYLLSSGSSGMFSFGLSKSDEQKMSSSFLDIMLHYYFKTLERKTLIINGLAQAVKLSSVSASTIDTGPRTDSVCYALRNISPNYEQTIVIGDNHLIKNSLEEAFENGIQLKKLKIYCVTGGIYLPENLRKHLTQLLGAHPEDDIRIFSSMGISEFGLNLFFESEETIRLRQMTSRSAGFLGKLLGNERAFYPNYLPMFFNYFPQFYFLEESQQQITITDLRKKQILPLIRYNTQDIGKIVDYNLLKTFSTDSQGKEFLPPFHSPLVLMYGKNDALNWDTTTIYPQQIQEGIYSDAELSFAATGNFKLIKKQKPHVLIQLKKDVTPTDKLRLNFSQTLFRFIPVDFEVILYSYQQFPYHMELDYEKKFKHV